MKDKCHQRAEDRQESKKCVYVLWIRVFAWTLYVLAKPQGGIIANFSLRTEALSPSLYPRNSIHPLQVQRVTLWRNENWRLSSLVEVTLPPSETAFASSLQACSDCPVFVCTGWFLCKCVVWVRIFIPWEMFLWDCFQASDHTKKPFDSISFARGSLLDRMDETLPADHAHT